MSIGDRLARGAKSAQFPASEGKVTQKRWDEIFGKEPKPVKESSAAVVSGK